MRRRSLALAIWRGAARRAVLALSPESPLLARLTSSAISGGVASCSRPSSAANSATPISTLDVTPVRKVPDSQRAETSRRSGGPLRPSAISGGSLPRSAMVLSRILHSDWLLFPRRRRIASSHRPDTCLSWRMKSTKPAVDCFPLFLVRQCAVPSTGRLPLLHARHRVRLGPQYGSIVTASGKPVYPARREAAAVFPALAPCAGD